MTRSKAQQELTRLRDAAVEDVLAMSDEELAEEERAAGRDPGQTARALRTSMREAAAAAVRRTRPAGTTSILTAPLKAGRRPPLEALQAAVRAVFQANPSHALAFRDGKRQSEDDWKSLYDDLVEMGAIQPLADED